MDHLLNVYNRVNIHFESGDGAWLFDADGRKYLDAYSGIAVCNLGHNYPEVTKTIQEQAAKLLHSSNFVRVPQQTILADKLIDLAGFEGQVFFNNSGAEAVETAIKLAHLYAHSKNIADPKIVVVDSAFHGRTMGTISAGGSAKSREGFAPYLPGFVRIHYNDPDAFKAAVMSDPGIVAILVEPIQGEAGVNVPSSDYLNKIRKICDDHNVLMMLDEVQTGVGRTGKFFCYEHNKILPDVITLAKGLANGIPIGACIIREPYCHLFTPGSHGATFGGNPLSCSAAITTIDEVIKKQWHLNAEKQGKKLLEGLKKALADNPHVVDIRGLGLMVGVELDCECLDLIPIALNHGVIFNIARLNTLRILPPLIYTDEQTQMLIDTIPLLINEFYQSRADA